MTEQQAIERYKALGDRLSAPNVTSKSQYWQDRADELALKCKASLAVVRIGDHYQVWNKTIADKCGADYEYIAEYKEDNNAD